MIAASVVDLPEPVGPVTSTRPRGYSARPCRTAGRLSSSSVLISVGIRRKAAPTTRAGRRRSRGSGRRPASSTRSRAGGSARTSSAARSRGSGRGAARVSSSAERLETFCAQDLSAHAVSRWAADRDVQVGRPLAQPLLEQLVDGSQLRHRPSDALSAEGRRRLEELESVTLR